MNKINELLLSQIEDIVAECEAVQKSQGSAYTKEQAKVNAYNEVRDVLGMGENE